MTDDEPRARPGYAAQPPQAATAHADAGAVPHDASVMKVRTSSAGDTPAVAVFAERDQDYRAVLHALVGVECLQCTTWDALERALKSADIGIAVLPLLDCSEYGRLLAFHSAHPLVPIVLVTRQDADNLRRLQGASIDDVVFLHTLLEELPPAARAALDSRCLTRAVRHIETMVTDDADLRNMLLRVCRLSVPPRTVA